MTPVAIAQVFYGVLFMATLESMLAHSAPSALTARAAQSAPRVMPRVNRAASYVSLLDYTVALLADPQRSLAETVAALHCLLQTNPKYNPEVRKFDRLARSPARSLRHQRYRKRLTS